VSCSGLNPSAVSALYFGIRNDQFSLGETMAGTGGPTANGPAIYRYSIGSGSTITYFGNTNPAATTIFNALPPGSTRNVSTRMLLTRTAGTAPIVTTGGTPANSANNGDIGALFHVTSTSFSVRVDVQALDSVFTSYGNSCVNLFNPTNTRSPGSGLSPTDQDVSRVDLGFYWQSLPTPTATSTVTGTATETWTPTATPTPADTPTVTATATATDTATPTETATPTVTATPVCGDAITNGSEECDEGAGNGASDSCCTAGCTFRASGETCRPVAGLCDAAETCTGSAGACPADAKSTAPCRPSAGVCDPAESCDGINDACPADAKSSAECRPSSGPCDPGESCDGSGDDCPLNVYQPDNTPCPDGLFCNGDETCQSGICSSGTAPCPISCDEATDQCRTTNCALSPLAGCRTAEKSLLLIKNKSDNTKDKLIWKWIKGAATLQAHFADPTTTADYALCIYAGTAQALAATVDVPPSAAKWSAVGVSGYKYFDAAGTENGIQKIKLKGSTQNKSKALLKGRGALLPDPLDNPPFDLPVTVQLLNASNGICFEATYSAAKTSATQFKAKQ
jgi:hypothetical protein